jgi:hypothetical protein
MAKKNKNDETHAPGKRVEEDLELGAANSTLNTSAFAPPVLVAPEPEMKQEETEPTAPNRSVRMRNTGEPFVIDLTAYGYGARWPTGAVYTIPQAVALKCIAEGMKGEAV